MSECYLRFLNRVPGRFGWFLGHRVCALWTLSAELTINGSPSGSGCTLERNSGAQPHTSNDQFDCRIISFPGGTTIRSTAQTERGDQGVQARVWLGLTILVVMAQVGIPLCGNRWSVEK